MPIRRRAGSPYWWADFTIDGVRRRVSTGQTDRRAAQAVEARLRADAAMGRGIGAEAQPAPALTLGEAASAWWRHHGQHLRSAQTIAHRLQILTRLIPLATPVADITPATIADAMARRRGEITHNGRRPTASTVNRDVLDTLRPILGHAAETLGEAPAAIKWERLRLPEPKPRRRALTADELERFMAALPGQAYRDLASYIRLYGWRLSEAFFPPAALDAQARRLTLRAGRKGGGAHVIPLRPEDARDLASRAGRAIAAGLPHVWFVEEGQGGAGLRPLTRRGFQAACARAMAAAGIEARPVHDLRHTALTEALRRTGDIRAVQALAGHSNIATTAAYAWTDDAAVLAALGHTIGTEGEEKAENSIVSGSRTGT